MYTRGKAHREGIWISIPNTDPDLDVILAQMAYAPDGPDFLEALDNAKRVYALWNMAHDLNLSTEAIEGGIVQEMVEKVRELRDHDKAVERAIRVPCGDAEAVAMGKRIQCMAELFGILSKIERQG